MRDILRIPEWGKVSTDTENENTFLPYQISGRALTSQAILLFFFLFFLFIVFHLEGLLNIGIYSKYSLDFTIVTFFFRGSCINFLAVMMMVTIMLIAL